MPNLGKMLKDEIVRLGRREANRAVVKLRKRIASLERVARQQRSAIDALRRQVARQVRDSPARDRPQSQEGSSHSRLSPALVRKLRVRLKLSQAQFAKLVGSSHVSVYMWEAGRAKPRGEKRDAILQLRNLGVREARQKLEQLPPPGRKRSTRAQPRATPSRRRATKRSPGRSKARRSGSRRANE